VCACVIESAKRGCSNVGPKFFVYQGVVQRCVAWFFPHIRCVQESLLVVILIGSLHLYIISPSPPLKYDGISGYLKCIFSAMKLGCVVIAILLLVHVAISLFVRDGCGTVFGGFCIRG
jgi:hypothetical protein